MKDHLISAAVTFVSTFLTTLGTVVISLDFTHIDKAAIFAAILSAVNVGIRAAIKVAVVPPAPVDGQ